MLSDEELANSTQHLRSFEAELAESRSHAKDLLDTQTSQVRVMKTHVEAQKLLGDSARVAEGLLDKVAAKAANIETILDDTTARFNELPLLGMPISPWTICALLLCLMAMQNPKLATILFLSGGKSTALNEKDTSTLTTVGMFFAVRLISRLMPMLFPAVWE